MNIQNIKSKGTTPVYEVFVMGGGLHIGDLLFEKKRGKKKASLSMMQVTDCLLLAHLQQIQILSILGKKKSFRVSTKAFLAS